MRDTGTMEFIQSADGTRLALQSWGEGPAVITVSGALSDRSAAAPLAELLTGFCVWAYDRRGRGDSGDNTRMKSESRQREIEDLQAVLAAVGSDALVFASGAGAVLALEASMRGTGIRRLALFEPPYTVGDHQPYRTEIRQELASLLADGLPGEAAEKFLLDVVREPPSVVAQLKPGPGWQAITGMAGTIIYDFNVMGDDGRVPAVRLGELRLPVLVIAGRESADWLVEAAAVTAQSLSNGTFLLLPGQTHLSQPEAIAPALRGFFLGERVVRPTEG